MAETPQGPQRDQGPCRSCRNRSFGAGGRPLPDSAPVRTNSHRGADFQRGSRQRSDAHGTQLLRDLNRSGKRDLPADAPMPFRKDWKKLVLDSGKPNRRLYEVAVFATLRNKLRSGDVWVERSSGYARFDSYLLPVAAVPAIANELSLPATADEWLAARGHELDQRLKSFAI